MLLEKARTAKDGGKKLYKGGDADLLPALRKLAGWDGAATGRVVGAWDADKNGKLSTGELVLPSPREMDAAMSMCQLRAA